MPEYGLITVQVNSSNVEQSIQNVIDGLPSDAAYVSEFVDEEQSPWVAIVTYRIEN